MGRSPERARACGTCANPDGTASGTHGSEANGAQGEGLWLRVRCAHALCSHLLQPRGRAQSICFILFVSWTRGVEMTKRRARTVGLPGAGLNAGAGLYGPGPRSERRGLLRLWRLPASFLFGGLARRTAQLCSERVLVGRECTVRGECLLSNRVSRGTCCRWKGLSVP